MLYQVWRSYPSYEGGPELLYTIEGPSDSATRIQDMYKAYIEALGVNADERHAFQVAAMDKWRETNPATNIPAPIWENQQADEILLKGTSKSRKARLKAMLDAGVPLSKEDKKAALVPDDVLQEAIDRQKTFQKATRDRYLLQMAADEPREKKVLQVKLEAKDKFPTPIFTSFLPEGFSTIQVEDIYVQMA